MEHYGRSSSSVVGMCERFQRGRVCMAGVFDPVPVSLGVLLQSKFYARIESSFRNSLT